MLIDHLEQILQQLLDIGGLFGGVDLDRSALVFAVHYGLFQLLYSTQSFFNGLIRFQGLEVFARLLHPLDQ